MDAVAHLRAEHVVNEPVLGEARKAGERRRTDGGVEVVAVSRHTCPGVGNPRLDALFDLIWSCGHAPKRSDRPLYFVKR